MNPIFALALACFGVSLAEGFLMANLFKAASRQPEIIGQLRSLMILVLPLSKVLSLLPLLWPSFLNNSLFDNRKGGC